MTKRLAGKKAFVTGGSRGIGAAIARRLAAEGADVAITYAGNEAAANQTVAAITAADVSGFAIQADGGDPVAAARAIETASERLGGIDIIVHNAGIAEFAPVGEPGGDSFERQFALNVGGVYHGTRAAIPHLRDGGRIIIIGSINAHAMPVEGGAVYGATKAAVAGLSKAPSVGTVQGQHE